MPRPAAVAVPPNPAPCWPGGTRRSPGTPRAPMARNPPRSRLLQPGQLLVDDRRVELGEQRLRRLKRRAWPDRRVLPPGSGLVVTGDDGIPRPAVLVHLIDPRHPGPGPGTSEHLVDPLRRLRQERGQQRLAVIHELQRYVADRPHPLRVRLTQLPWRLFGEVLVRLRERPHGLRAGRLESRPGK